MTEDQKQEREDWEALLASDGWKRLVAFATEHYVGSEAFKKSVMLKLHTVPEIVCRTEGVDAVMSHPHRRLTVLSQPVLVADRFAKQRRVP